MNPSLSPIYSEDGFPHLVGHRGCYDVLENSIKGFQAALELDIKIIELDIWLSKDDIPVVIHCCDETGCISETVTNGKGKVNEFLKEELILFNIGQDQTLPTLEEVLKVIGKRAVIIIEFKEQSKKEKIVLETIKVVRENSMENNVSFCSFSHDYYDILRRNKITNNFCFNIETQEEYLQAKNKSDSFNSSICCREDFVNKDDIEVFHKRNQGVSVFLLPHRKGKIDSELLETCADLKIDLLMCDYPQETRELMKKVKQKRIDSFNESFSTENSSPKSDIKALLNEDDYFLQN